MTNCTVSHMSDIIKLIVINAMNGVLEAKVIQSTTTIQFNGIGYVHNPSPFIDANSVGQNKQIGDSNLANQFGRHASSLPNVENVRSVLVQPNVNVPVRLNMPINVDNSARSASLSRGPNGKPNSQLNPLNMSKQFDNDLGLEMGVILLDY